MHIILYISGQIVVNSIMLRAVRETYDRHIENNNKKFNMAEYIENFGK